MISPALREKLELAAITGTDVTVTLTGTEAQILNDLIKAQDRTPQVCPMHGTGAQKQAGGVICKRLPSCLQDRR